MPDPRLPLMAFVDAMAGLWYLALLGLAVWAWGETTAELVDRLDRETRAASIDAGR